MGKKNDNFAFGVFQDGLTVKIAELVSIDGTVKILRLEKAELRAPLYPKPTETLAENYLSLDNYTEDIEEKDVQDFDELSELNQLENLEIPETLEGGDLPVTMDSEQEMESPESYMQSEESVNGKGDLQKLLQTFPITKGKIAFSTNDEQISYHQFDSAFATNKLRKKLKQEILSKEELKIKNYALDYIINPNGSGLAFAHRGSFELLDAIQELNPILTKKKFLYSHIDTNEISLINLVRNCYDYPSEDFVTVLYIGIDYKVGIVLKDNNHIKTFPIIITETDPEKKRQAIYSKIILEQDISNTPITQHVILAGEDVTDEDVAYYQEKGFYWDPLKRLELKDIELVETEEDSSSSEIIAQYAIPISLAWKALEIKGTKFHNCNLLPTKIIESQKYFKIAWHGFLILAIIFYVALWGTLNNLEIKQEIKNIQKEQTRVQTVISEINRKITQVNLVKDKINVIEAKNQLVKDISEDKNQWHKILKDLSIGYGQNSISWIRSIRNKQNELLLSGLTSRRRNIITFSNFFPECEIKSITPIFIEEVPIWNYEMIYQFPKVKEEQKKIVATKVEPPQILNNEPESYNEITLLYHDIITAYFAGRISESHQRFIEFANNYPDHKRAYNATYFTGECNFIEGNIDKAVTIFSNILSKNGSKNPDCLIMLGNSYNKLGNLDKAMSFWQRVLDEYPEHELAELAKFKLMDKG